MKSDWFTPKEITKMPGMPTTIQGVHKKAKREGWHSRRKLGVQGPAVEFCMVALEEKEENIKESSAVYQIPLLTSDQDLRTVWLAVFNQLTEKNRTLLISNIIQYGVYQLINYEKNTRAATIASLVESLPPADQTLILDTITNRQLALSTASAAAPGSATAAPQEIE